ncbi:MAG: glycosyltransferase family 39 protein [candidate division KSB1 bacterium]|nr:glycosyltransferase family 39 protein [candidate division KSB1 bacterium]MDZ7411986.1 glycosyltransferase family 39 protein [candidate division KSB1 bacterium]
MHNESLTRFARMAALVLGLGLVTLRFVRLEADPDTSLSMSRVFYTDEGYNSCNALNKSITGHWLCDRNNHILLMPVMPVVQYVFFKLLGLSLASARLPAAILSVGAMALMLLMVRRRMREGRRSAQEEGVTLVLALFLLGTNYYFFVYGRLALLDLPMTAFGLASLLVFHRALAVPQGKRAWWHVAAAGMLLGVAFLAKPSAALYGTALLVLGLIQAIVEPRAWRQWTTKVFGALLVAAVVVGVVRCGLWLVAAGYRDLTPTHLISDRITVHLRTILRNYVKFFNNPVVRRNWELLLLAYFNVVLIAFYAARNGVFRLADRVMISYLIACYVFLGFFVHQLPRYFVVLVIPVTYLVATLPVNVGLVFGPRRGAKMRVAAVMLILMANWWNVVRLVNYHREPAYSLRMVAQQVKERVMANGVSHGGDAILCGDVAATLALANGMRFSFDVHHGVQGQYLLAQGEAALPGYKLTPIGTFDLLGNYYCYDYGSRRMHLYRVQE